MLLWLFHHLPSFWPQAGGSLAALEKITFRSALAALASFLLALLWGPRWIGWLRRHFREPNVSDSPRLRELHARKQATPTMGGLFIMAALLAGVLVFGDLTNRYVQLAMLLAAGLAAVGAVDDLVKLRGVAKGLSPQAKLAGQILVSGVVAVLLYCEHAHLPGGLALRLPLLQGGFAMGWWFVPFAILVLVGSSNAVNLTDGLDGLAGGCLLWAVGAMTVLVYVSGHAELAHYLHVPGIPGAGEMTIVCGGMIGGLLGFLWFNCHPAEVFMGDTGSLPLGGLLGLLALVTRQELLLLAIGGVFVAEAASVILQVGYYKWRGRRIFRCAPLHHHFQFQGWPESRIVVRFWIAAALCALLGIATLKLGVRETPATQLVDDGRWTVDGEPRVDHRAKSRSLPTPSLLTRRASTTGPK
jgi:phospho-N-acetylmuramoyl-pentapeptide-transferase